MSPDHPRPWRRLLPTVGVILLLLVLFHGTATEMVGIWRRSETFTHAFLVPPIVVWLIWRQRFLLATLPDRPRPLLLVLVAGACFLWLLGQLATVGAAAQFALVSMIVLTVVAVHGWTVTRALAFPLAFLFFCVPLGEFLVPSLMEGTADFTVLALRATGIPVYREGLQFVIPSGTWSVVEACSGVRYLIASFMVGTLFAYLNFHSLSRRLAFVAVSLLVPVLANWMRAYMIVMIGHLSGNELATGVDHLVYGWVFFGIVIGLMFMIGARFADASEPPQAADLGPVVAGPLQPLLRVAGALIALFVATIGVLRWLDHDPRGAPVAPDLQWAAQSEWKTTEGPPLPWKPGFSNPTFGLTQAYRRGDRTAWVWIGYFRQQGTDRKMVSSVNGLVPVEQTEWVQSSRGVAQVESASGTFAVRTGELRQGAALESVSSPRIRVWMVYRVGQRWTNSDAVAKVLQAMQQLSGQGDDGAVVLMATPAHPQADEALGHLAREALPILGPRLDAVARSR